jgi:lantibiotic biosynthesis protein
MLTAIRDPDQRALLPGIGLCHGKAGLLQSAWRMAAHARDSHLAAELPGLAAQLTAQLSGPVTDPELMDGAAGAALALHTIGTGTAPASRWDAFLLLA